MPNRSEQKANSGEENSLTTPAGTQAHNLFGHDSTNQMSCQPGTYQHFHTVCIFHNNICGTFSNSPTFAQWLQKEVNRVRIARVHSNPPPDPPTPHPLPQWHVKDPSHFAKSAGGRLRLNTHSVGTYPETSLHVICQEALGQSRLS